MAFKFLKNLWEKYFSRKQEVPKVRSQGDLRSEFLNTYFEGGTLVEYQEGYQRDVEFGRGIVREMRLKRKGIDINTDGKARFGIADYINIINLSKKDGVFSFEGAIPGMNWKYSIAPPGVKIPKKPTLEEISKE